MKGLKAENLVTSRLVSWVVFRTNGRRIGDPLNRVPVRLQPPAIAENSSDFSQKIIQIPRGHHSSNHHVAMGIHLVLQNDGPHIARLRLAKRFHLFLQTGVVAQMWDWYKTSNVIGRH